MSAPERGRFLQNMQERCNEISTETLFFTLELNRLDDAVIERQLQDPAARRYAPWIRDSRMYRPHQLADELEKLLHEKSVTGAGAWIRLFDQTLAELRFAVDGKSLTLADTLNLLDNPDAQARRTAAKALGHGLGERTGIFTLIVNTLAKDKEIEDKWRQYPLPISYRNLANKVENEVVEAMVSAIRDAYAELAHRYYKIKAGWFGRAALDYWDRNAPLPGGRQPPLLLERGTGNRARCVRPLRSPHVGDRPTFLRRSVDRRAAAPRQGFRRVLPSRGAVGASVRADELLWPIARRDDTGA